MANNNSKSSYLGYAIAAIIGLVIIILLFLAFWDPNGTPNNNVPGGSNGNNTTTNGGSTPGNGNGTTTNGTNGNGVISDWINYTNQDYSFSLRYPETWTRNDSAQTGLEPKINFYRNLDSAATLPLTHFANQTHVSVYPQGIGTEGLVGESRDLNFNVGFPVAENSRMYVLDDGTPYAAYILPQNPPSSWNDSGFIWMRLRIENLETTCIVNGQEVSEDECNPLSGDARIQRSGRVNNSLWETEKQIVSTFNFTDTDTENQLIELNQPTESAVISSPLTIQGRARGQWYFEASFPVVLTNWDGEIIAEGNAQAQDNWMTEEFVPFRAELRFNSPYQSGDPEFMQNGNLILQKANPSGLPENDDALEIQIKFQER